MTEPVGDQTVKQMIASLKLEWVDMLDWESERRAVIEVTNGVGSLFLPRGRQGEKGLDGEPGPGLAPDAVVNYATDALALAALPTGLGPDDRGFCVINQPTQTAFFWTKAGAWIAVADAIAQTGPQGPPVGVAVGTVTTSPSGGSAAVSLDPSSTDAVKVFNFTLPRGPQGSIGIGSQGPPGTLLESASDVDWPVGGPVDGQTLVWNASTGMAEFQYPTTGATGPYAADPNTFAIINDNSWPQEYKQVVKLDIPAQPFAWHPRCYAYVDVKVNGIMTRVDLEARLNAVSGAVVGRGPGTQISGFLENFTTRSLVPVFESALVPSSLAAYVAAGAPASLYLIIRRIDSLVTFGVETRRDRAGFAVYCDPIPGA